MAETYWERKLWEPDIETMPRKEIRELQKKKLFPQLIYAYENARFYHELYDKEKVDVYKIRTIEDFQKYVPVMDKEMVREYRERTGDLFGGLLSLPLDSTVYKGYTNNAYAGRVFKSTGSTGTPTVFIYTENDIDTIGTLCARLFWRCGLRPGERVWHDCSIPWHAYVSIVHDGFRKVGAFVYSDNTIYMTGGAAADIEIAKRFGVTTMVTITTDGRVLLAKMEREGTTLKKEIPTLQRSYFSGELSKSMVEYYHRMFGVPMVNVYGVTETGWYAGSCVYEGDVNMTLHMPEDTHFVEIFPPGSDEAVEGAEFGEPVLTNLVFESMAYIRWRSEDWARVRYDSCPYCGYTHMQNRIMSRTSESLDVKGKLITMGEMEEIIYAHPESRPLPIQIIREEPQPQDKLRLRICYKTELVKEPERYRLKVEQEMKEGFGIDTEVALITPEEVARVGGGAKMLRVIKEKRQSLG